MGFSAIREAYKEFRKRGFSRRFLGFIFIVALVIVLILVITQSEQGVQELPATDHTEPTPYVVTATPYIPHIDESGWRRVVEQQVSQPLYHDEPVHGQISTEENNQEYLLPVEIPVPTFVRLITHIDSNNQSIVELYELDDNLRSSGLPISPQPNAGIQDIPTYTYVIDPHDEPRRYGIVLIILGVVEENIDYTITMQQFRICTMVVNLTETTPMGIPVHEEPNSASTEINDPSYPMGYDTNGNPVSVSVIDGIYVEQDLWYEIVYPPGPDGKGWVYGTNLVSNGEINPACAILLHTN